MTSHYVELNRGFEVHQDDEPLEELAQRSYSSGAASAWEPLTWEKLLEHIPTKIPRLELVFKRDGQVCADSTLTAAIPKPTVANRSARLLSSLLR
jgi:hypothetical protein